MPEAVQDPRHNSNPSRGGSDEHPDHVLRRVKLPPPGLQSAGRHQGQVRHHRQAPGEHGRGLLRRHRQHPGLWQPG